MASAYCLADWLSEIDDIALSSTVAAPGAQGSYVRTMGYLIGIRPDELGGAGMTADCQAEVIRGVIMGAFESAALRLLPDDARVMTSTPGQGRYLATVRLQGQESESTSTGNTFALALVSALALSIVEQFHELSGPVSI